jgi:ribonuclease-3
VEPKLKQLEQKLNIHFKQPELLELALIHPSYLSEHPEVKEHNQRLEFLGDAVLGAAVAYYLYQKYPESAEGNLTKTRAAVVCEASLAALAQDLELGEYICLGRGEASSGGKERASILLCDNRAIDICKYFSFHMRLIYRSDHRSVLDTHYQSNIIN